MFIIIGIPQPLGIVTILCIDLGTDMVGIEECLFNDYAARARWALCIGCKQCHVFLSFPFIELLTLRYLKIKAKFNPPSAF